MISDDLFYCYSWYFTVIPLFFGFFALGEIATTIPQLPNDTNFYWQAFNTLKEFYVNNGIF